MNYIQIRPKPQCSYRTVDARWWILSDDDNEGKSTFKGKGDDDDKGTRERDEDEEGTRTQPVNQ